MKEYLGDSVYAELLPHGATKLTTENGYEPSNTIIMEVETINAFAKFCNRAADVLSERANKLREQARSELGEKLSDRTEQEDFRP